MLCIKQGISVTSFAKIPDDLEKTFVWCFKNRLALTRGEVEGDNEGKRGKGFQEQL